ncbi:MAG: hypothetical protein H6R04_613 [Burkholderiaceae bacterium]|nr:hypothetical protein [Burkholderiaceae bacterium]
MGMLDTLTSPFHRPPAIHGPATAGDAIGIPLGIAGLPPDAGLCPAGSLSVLVLREQASARQISLATARLFLQTMPTAIVAASQDFMDHAAAFADSKNTVFLQLANACQQAIARHGMQRILHELDACGATEHHALLLRDGQMLFDWRNQETLFDQWRTWKHWAEMQHAPVLIIVEDLNGAHGLLPLLRGLGNLLPNMALLDVSGDTGLLTLERWNEQDNSGQRQFGLKRLPGEETLVADGSEISRDRQLILDAPDQKRVIATAAALDGASSAPEGWTVVNSLAEMEAACTDLVAATLLLHTDGDGDFDDVSRFIYTMRKAHPHTLKIIVRETRNKLRYSNELAFLRMGANRVVYREVSFSRLLQLLDELADQAFNRPLIDDYALAVKAVAPNRVGGYLQPTAFCDEVETMLARSEHIHLMHCLVRLPLLSRVPHLVALQACRVQRPGDVFTADHGNLYLFLYACREQDLEQILGRLFSLPMTELFSAHIIKPSNNLILSVLQRLRRINDAETLPDYSSLMPNQSALRDQPTTPHAAQEPQKTAADILPLANDTDETGQPAAVSRRTTWPAPLPHRTVGNASSERSA